MSKPPRRKLWRSLVAAAAVTAVVSGAGLMLAQSATGSTPASSVVAAKKTPTPGDNGTVKTHNVGTSTDDVRDEPKVCNFYLDAFFFDGVQSVNWWIDQNTHGTSVLSGSITLDATGHGFTSNYTLPNGMYKLYWTFDGEHGSAKHKVFKVDCAPVTTPPTTTTPPPPPTGPVVTDTVDCSGITSVTVAPFDNIDTIVLKYNGADHVVGHLATTYPLPAGVTSVEVDVVTLAGVDTNSQLFVTTFHWTKPDNCTTTPPVHTTTPPAHTTPPPTGHHGTTPPVVHTTVVTHHSTTVVVVSTAVAPPASSYAVPVAVEAGSHTVAATTNSNLRLAGLVLLVLGLVTLLALAATRRVPWHAAK